MEAKPNTKLRSLAISVLFNKGYAGPNYNLDDVSAIVTKNLDSIDISFWDMSCIINPNNKYYNDILEELNKEVCDD